MLVIADLLTVEMGYPDRPNVVVYAGYDISGQPMVVFVDRFEHIAFHSEPGDRRFGWLF